MSKVINIDGTKGRYCYIDGTRGVVGLRDYQPSSDGHTFRLSNGDILWISGYEEGQIPIEDYYDYLYEGFYFTIDSGIKTLSFWTNSYSDQGFFQSAYGFFDTSLSTITNPFEVDIFEFPDEEDDYMDYNYNDCTTPYAFEQEYPSIARYKFRYNQSLDSWVQVDLDTEYSILPLNNNVTIKLNNHQYYSNDNGYVWYFTLSDGSFAMSAWDTTSYIGYDPGGIFCLSMHQFCGVPCAYTEGDGCKVTIWVMDEEAYYDAYFSTSGDIPGPAGNNTEAQALSQKVSNIIQYLRNEGVSFTSYSFEYEDDTETWIRSYD